MPTKKQVSKENDQWLREVETTAKTLEASTSGGGLTTELRVLTESIFKINENLSVLAILGGGPPDPEFDSVVDTITQDFRVLLPWVRMIYEARKDQWFDRGNVLQHGYCHARTWHELVLKNAEEFTEGARLISARRACRLLHDSQYESGKVQIHLELEFEHAGKPDDQSAWTPALIEKGKRIIADTAGIKSKQFARAMKMSDAEGGELYRNLTGKPKQSRRTN